jgi:hypothetical protein
MKLLQSALARLSTPAHRAPVSQPQRLDTANLQQVSGGLPRVSAPAGQVDALLLPRVS